MTYEVIALRHPGIGSKRVCVGCTARFYDLSKTPPVCPKCGVEQPPEPPRPPPMRRSTTRMRPMKAPVPVAAEADDDAAPVLDADDEDEAEPDEDAAEIEIDDEEPADVEPV